jgi:hypothetical protein
MLMIPTDVAGHPLLHEQAQRRFSFWLYNKMEMVGHETQAQHFDWEFRLGGSQQMQKRRVVAIFVEHRRTIPTVQHMIGMTRYLSAWNAWHESGKVAGLSASPQGKVASPHNVRLQDLTLLGQLCSSC